MLHVLRHYLPLRKTLLIASETILISLVLLIGMTSHLWQVDTELRHLLAEEGLDRADAIWLTFFSSVTVAVLTQITISFNELYDFRISNSPYDRAARFMGSAGSAVLLVAVTLGLAQLWGADRLLYFPGLPFTQTIVLMAFSLGCAFLLLYFWRILFHSLMRKTSFNQRLLILGSGRFADRMVQEVQHSTESGYEIVAVVTSSDSGDPRLRSVVEPAGTSAPRIVTDLEAGGLFKLANGLDVSDIVVAYEDRRGRLPTEELLCCRLSGMVIHEAESFFEHVSGKIPAEAMRPSYLIFNRGFVQHPMAAFGKRLFDILFAIVVLAVAWPIMLVAALAVRLDSKGPILFRQKRTGASGKPFTLCKYRSMRSDAEKLTGPVWAQKDDPRITRVGHFLRRTRIDELPQLFNVFAGTMSFVGPRPERPSFVEELSDKIPYYQQRHIVRPGLTGWAQINYPYGNTVEDALQKLQYDLFYIKYQSFLFDMSIVLNTVKTVVLRKGT